MNKKICLYDKSKIDKNNHIFSNRALVALLVPIIIEQLLNSLMGMTDTIMVSNVGKEAITAVSLVDSINNLIIMLFSAMATGGSIICSQYIGSNDKKGANNAARQVIITVLTISLTIMIFGMIFCKPLLRLVFGKVEDQVMKNCIIYYLVTAVSYPVLALFNAGAAFFRAGGNSKFPMKVAFISNIVNIIGNSVFIFACGLGVLGAAISTLVSRIICAAVIFVALRKPKQIIVINNYLAIRPDIKLIKKVLSVGIPAGVENSMFQFGKLAIQSTISTLPTEALAAQAMTNIMENLNGIAGIAVGIGLMTVVGQCIGAGRKEEAKYYVVKLTGIAELAIIASCLLVFALAKPITIIGGMEPVSASLCMKMIGAITIVKPLVWTLSFVPAYGMRAAGDVRFSMITSIITMWCMRVALCVFLVKVVGLGTMAVWYGMFADWTIRGIIFAGRFLSGKWLKEKMI